MTDDTNERTDPTCEIGVTYRPEKFPHPERVAEAVLDLDGVDCVSLDARGDQRVLTLPTSEVIAAMTREDVRADLGRSAYSFGLVFEAMEHARTGFGGNGHHVAQELQRRALELFDGHWREEGVGAE